MTSFSERRPTGVHAVFAVLAAVFLFTLSASSQGPKQTSGIEVVNGHEAAAGEVLVKFRGSENRDVVVAMAQDVDADHYRPVGSAKIRLFHSRRFSTAELVARLSKRPNVEYVEPNYVVRTLQAPSDPQFPQLWGLQNVGQAVNGGAAGTSGADSHAVAAWQVSTGTRSVVVAVIDSGIEYTHPDLVPNVWSAPVPFSVTLGGVTITCDAGTHGFNAITRTCDPMDDHNHGTHVSGTIGAAGNNDIGVVGVNWATTIMAAKFVGPDGSGTMADAIDAIEFTIQAKAAFAATSGADVRVLSNSWGGDGFSQALLDEINRANQEDMLFVAAAGNNGLPNDLFPMYPASYDAPNIIAVAATDNADRKAYFSNYGATTVHLGAPGVDILSTTIGNTYSFFSGTSMATPHVSGAAALVLSRCSLDTAGLKAELLANVDPVPGLAGATITGGRLNVDKAIWACSAPPAVPTGLSATIGNALVSLSWLPASGATTYSVKRSTNRGGPYAAVAAVNATNYVDGNLTNDVTYYYVVSARNLMGESGDSNEVSATPKLPADLVIYTLTLPASAGSGDLISVSDTTRNQGPGVATPSTTRFYLSTNLTLDAADTPLGGGRAVPSLSAGAASAGSTSLALPSGLSSGTYYIFAKADGDGTVFESSDANNTLARAISIGPDLTVSSLVVPATVAPGALVSVTDTVRNQGGGVAGATTTRFYLSTNISLDAGDTVLDGSRSVPPLAAGASSTGSASVAIPADLGVGTYYVIAKADADGAVAESSEANNTMARSVQSGADLVVSSLTVPSTVGAGTTIVVTDTTKNQGSAPAGISTTRFYLSTNLALDDADTLLGGGRPVAALGPGASSGGTTSLTIPAGLAVGTYYVIAKADADNAVAESAESNNTLARAISVGPDLTVSALQAPASIAAGSVIAVTDTVKNQGAGTAGASTTRFYLSTNFILDAADVMLDGVRAVPPLSPGFSSTGTTSVTVPASLAVGTYYIIAKADADESVAETSENNNTNARSVAVGPDLTVSMLQAPLTVAAGAVITVSDTVKNLGASPAGASTTRFYLSTNFTLDTADIPLAGTRSVPALVPGGFNTGTTAVTIPAGLAPGSYYLIAKTDADDVVQETTESNNTFAKTIQITVGAI